MLIWHKQRLRPKAMATALRNHASRSQRQRQQQRRKRPPVPLLHQPQPPSQPALSRSAPIASRWACHHAVIRRPFAGFGIQIKRKPLSPLRPAESAARWGTFAQIAVLPKRYCRFGLCAPSPHILTGKFLTRHALIRRSPVIGGHGDSCVTFDQRRVSSKV